jgi:thiamine-monophosphate kinase
MREPALRALLQDVQRGAVSIDEALTALAPEHHVADVAEVEAEPHGDEFSRVRELAALFGPASSPESVMLGIGDDAAVLHPQSDPWVFSVDVAVESVHFERAFATLGQLGSRAFSAAVSDLAAMAATPVAALSALVLPSDFSQAAFRELTRGIAQAAARYGCPVIGGNLSSGRELSLTTTVIGALTGPALYRSGARPGDDIYVTGRLGSAALGLALLQRGATALAPQFVDAWRAPEARLQAAQQIREHATSAIDVSDGALQDLGHLCEASGTGALLWAERLPFAPDFERVAREIGGDPLNLSLLGGEDYELIYTLPAGTNDRGVGTRIGQMLAETAGVQVLDAQGQDVTPRGDGFRHF